MLSAFPRELSTFCLSLGWNSLSRHSVPIKHQGSIFASLILGFPSATLSEVLKPKSFLPVKPGAYPFTRLRSQSSPQARECFKAKRNPQDRQRDST